MNEIIYAKVSLFVIRFIYNDKKSKTLAESRCLIWKRMKKKTTQRLPPDEDTMRGHIIRSNYVIYMNLQYACPNALEAPYNHGWLSQDGVCVPRRYKNPTLPTSLIITQTCEDELYDNDSDGEDDEGTVDDIIRESDSDDDKTDEELSADEE